MTLLEVLAGLAILGTLLVATLVARGDHARQWRHAQDRLLAIERANDQLATWWRERDKLPYSGSGTLDAEAGLTWRTSIIDNRQATDLGFQVVRFEVLNTRRIVLTQVDLYLPPPPPPEAPEPPEPPEPPDVQDLEAASGDGLSVTNSDGASDA